MYIYLLFLVLIGWLPFFLKLQSWTFRVRKFQLPAVKWSCTSSRRRIGHLRAQSNSSRFSLPVSGSNMLCSSQALQFQEGCCTVPPWTQAFSNLANLLFKVSSVQLKGWAVLCERMQPWGFFNCDVSDFTETLWTTTPILKAYAQTNLGNFPWDSTKQVFEDTTANNLFHGWMCRDL